MTEFGWVFWYWWVGGLVFLVIEILASGFFFLWLAVAAAITGVLVWLIPSISLSLQIFIFALLSIASIFAWKFLARKTKATNSDHPTLNRRGEQYLGRIFNLHQAIENGEGKIKVDDTIWKVHGEDCNISTKVKVTAVRGTVFDVAHVDDDSH